MATGTLPWLLMVCAVILLAVVLIYWLDAYMTRKEEDVKRRIRELRDAQVSLRTAREKKEVAKRELDALISKWDGGDNEKD